MSANLLAIFYLISGVLFILALRGLSSPETSRQGNLFGIIGMAIAIGVTILSVGNFDRICIFISFLNNRWINRCFYSFQNTHDSNARASCWVSQLGWSCCSFCSNFSFFESNSFQFRHTR